MIDLSGRIEVSIGKVSLIGTSKFATLMTSPFEWRFTLRIEEASRLFAGLIGWYRCCEINAQLNIGF